MASAASDHSIDGILSNLITASHILHYHNVVDAYGHISVRDPKNPDIFWMSRNLAPALVTSRDDLVPYWVSNAEPVEKNAPAGFSERAIHSSILRRFPNLMSVIHSHSQDIVPYTVSDVPLRPVLHMAGFIGHSAPVWDIARCYDDKSQDYIYDLLVRDTHIGDSLATAFGVTADSPDHRVVLMRGHGFTTASESIETAVFQAVYAQNNARIQTSALTLNATLALAESQRRELAYLHDRETVDTTKYLLQSHKRPWLLWTNEVEASNLYVNNIKRGGRA